MIMPVVSFAPMAMNESICATCCYRIVSSPSNYFWEVLHGGWYGYRPENYPAWQETIDAGWMEFPFDLEFAEGLITVPFFNPEKKEWWVQYSTDDFQSGQLSVDDFLIDERFAKKIKESCLHADEECAYIAVGVPPSYREHVDSTEPHLTATGAYLSPHQAVQFGS